MKSHKMLLPATTRKVSAMTVSRNARTMLPQLIGEASLSIATMTISGVDGVSGAVFLHGVRAR